MNSKCCEVVKKSSDEAFCSARQDSDVIPSEPPVQRPPGRTAKKASMVFSDLGSNLASDSTTIGKCPESAGISVKQVCDINDEIQRSLDEYCLDHSLDGAFRHVCLNSPCPWDHEGVRHIGVTKLSDEEQLSTMPLDPNMHLVVQRYIRKKTAGHGCGLASVLHPGCLHPAKVFISHSWEEIFKNFVAALRSALNQETYVWICSFALDQNSDITAQLGTDIFQSPFARALANADVVIMIIDKNVGPLMRVWCVFEMYLAHRLRKNFSMWAPNMVEGLWHTVEARVEGLKVHDCSASNEEDYNRIMSAISGLESELEKNVKLMVQNTRRVVCAAHGQKAPLLRSRQLPSSRSKRASGSGSQCGSRRSSRQLQLTKHQESSPEVPDLLVCGCRCFAEVLQACGILSVSSTTSQRNARTANRVVGSHDEQCNHVRTSFVTDFGECSALALHHVLEKYSMSYAEANDLVILSGFDVVLIVDDSGSMLLPSIPAHMRKLGVRFPSRWDELMKAVEMIVDVATCFDETGVDIFFLNRAPVYQVTSRHDVAFLDAFHYPPHSSSGTPLKQTFERVVAECGGEKPVLLVILTDGQPTDASEEDFENSIRKVVTKQSTPHEFRIQFMACTEDEDLIAYLNKIDQDLSEVDVIDDYLTEKDQVMKAGKMSEFTYGDWCMKALLGPVLSKHDHVDEKSAARFD